MGPTSVVWGMCEGWQCYSTIWILLHILLFFLFLFTLPPLFSHGTGDIQGHHETHPYILTFLIHLCDIPLPYYLFAEVPSADPNTPTVSINLVN